jgi:hypothetical protein
MSIAHLQSFESLLDQIRAIHDRLAELHGGVAVLHMDAAAAALADHIDRQQAANDVSLPRQIPLFQDERRAQA